MIKKLSVDYEKQIYFISHNANFVDLLNKNVEVFLLSKKDKKAHNVTQILGTVGNKQFTTWIHYNKHVLFSSCVILLEGFSDQIVLNHLIGKLNHNAFSRNFTFCSVAIAKENGGKSKIPEYQKIMSQFFTCWALYDFDILLDTSNELGKYITDTELSTFKAELVIKGITNKAQLKSFYNTSGNDISFINRILTKLETNHKVITLTKGEMEDYCQTLSGSKLANKIYTEVDYISTQPTAIITQKYEPLIKMITKIDELASTNIVAYRNLIFKLIMNFYAESFQMNPYNYSDISKELSNHLKIDPDYCSDTNYRFKFRFLSDIEFIIPKIANEPQKKSEIDTKLQN